MKPLLCAQLCEHIISQTLTHRDAERLGNLPTSHRKKEHTGVPTTKRLALPGAYPRDRSPASPRPIPWVSFHSFSQTAGLALTPFPSFYLSFSSQMHKYVSSTSDQLLPHCKSEAPPPPALILYFFDQLLIPMCAGIQGIPQVRQPSSFPNEKIPAPYKFWSICQNTLYDTHEIIYTMSRKQYFSFRVHLP